MHEHYSLVFNFRFLFTFPRIFWNWVIETFFRCMPGVGFMIRVVGFGSKGPEFKSRSPIELIRGGVNSARHPSEVGKMSATMLVSCVGVATHTGLCPIAKETD